MSPRRKISVIVADRHPVVLEGLKASLKKNEKINVIDVVPTGKKCIKVVEDKKPDVALIGSKLPDVRSEEIIQIAKTHGIPTKFIILSDGDEYDYIHGVVKAGAYGFVLKDSPVDEIIEAIEKVYSGHTYFSEGISQMLLNDYVKSSAPDSQTTNKLSNREKEILKLIADGFTTKDIAVQLGISPRTVDTHRERIMNKLNIHSIAGLTKYAIKNRITVV